MLIPHVLGKFHNACPSFLAAIQKVFRACFIEHVLDHGKSSISVLLKHWWCVCSVHVWVEENL